MLKTWTSLIMLIATLSSLSGCATRGTAIPQGGPTMAEIYQEAMRQSNGETLKTARNVLNTYSAVPTATEMSAYTRNTTNEIYNLFPLLPNPQLVMYVYPHLASDEQLPVPGYSTAFPLYTKTHYALPGETQIQ